MQYDLVYKFPEACLAVFVFQAFLHIGFVIFTQSRAQVAWWPREPVVAGRRERALCAEKLKTPTEERQSM